MCFHVSTPRTFFIGSILHSYLDDHYNLHYHHHHHQHYHQECGGGGACPLIKVQPLLRTSDPSCFRLLINPLHLCNVVYLLHLCDVVCPLHLCYVVCPFHLCNVLYPLRLYSCLLHLYMHNSALIPCSVQLFKSTFVCTQQDALPFLQTALG